MAQADSIGARVRMLRERQGWTQEDLAKLLHQGRSSIKNKELDERSFSIWELEKLSDIFKVSLDWLIRGVKAENLEVHRSLGLDDSAIRGLREHNGVRVFADPEMDPPIRNDSISIHPDPSLNAALASPAILQALSAYMAFYPEKREQAVGRAEQGGGYVKCLMSDGMYEAVLGQNLLRVLDSVKQGKEPDLYDPGLVFETVEDEKGGAQDGKEE